MRSLGCHQHLAFWVTVFVVSFGPNGAEDEITTTPVPTCEPLTPGGECCGNEEIHSFADTSAVLAKVKDTPYSIGYSVFDTQLVAGQETNSLIVPQIIAPGTGQAVKVSVSAIMAAVRHNAFLLSSNEDSTCPGFGTCSDIFAAAAADAWPITTLTYILVIRNSTGSAEECQRQKGVYNYVNWMIQNPVSLSIASDNQFSSLPLPMIPDVISWIDEMTCNGENVYNAQPWT